MRHMNQIHVMDNEVTFKADRLWEGVDDKPAYGNDTILIKIEAPDMSWAMTMFVDGSDATLFRLQGQLHDLADQVSELASIIPDTRSENLVSHWALDDNADSTTVSDSSGTGNDGAAQLNTSVLHTDGIVDGALEFNGDDYVRIPGFSELSGSSSATIAFAAKQYGNALRNNVLWANGNVLIEFGGSGNTGLRIRWNLDGAWRNTHSVQNVLDTDTWHHWAFTFDQGATKIYRDGVEIYTGSDSQTSISTSSPDYYIGYRARSGGFNGVIDEVRIYDEALGSDRIQSLHENP